MVRDLSSFDTRVTEEIANQQLFLCDFFPECSNYKFLNESTRAVTYNHSVFYDCGESKLLGWYRFGGDAGTQMADTCVMMRHCGARYPGWLSGGHPSVSDGAVLRKVCFTGSWGCCHYSAFISVRNCNGFYVYKLSTLTHYYYYYYYYHSYYYQCNSRYCSSNGSERPTTGGREICFFVYIITN